MTKSTSRTKTSKKFAKKKSSNTVHPYIECVQQEINSLQEELTLLESKQELTAEEEKQLVTTRACLERYQSTMSKLTEQTMSSKVQQLNSITENEIRQRDETQLFSFLQVLYLMRLGQLGLYGCLENAPPLQSVSNLCDQVIGASIYYAKDPSPQVREHKRHKIRDILKKLEQGSNDSIEESDTTTFKQIKEFLQHIWDNTIECTEHVNNNNQIYSVIQFEGMVPQQDLIDNTHTPEVTNSEELALEPVIESTPNPTVDSDQLDVNPTADTCDNEASNDSKTHVTKDALNKEANATKDTWNKEADSTKDTWSQKAHAKKDKASCDAETPDNSQQSTFDSWEKESESKDATQQEADNSGWDSVDSPVQAQTWDSTDRAWDLNNVMDENTSSAAVESHDTKDSSDNDNWRNRDDNSGRGRGRGRGTRGRGGRGRGRGRGRGIRGGGIRGGGRGRGRGREVDEDYIRNYSPQTQE